MIELENSATREMTDYILKTIVKGINREDKVKVLDRFGDLILRESYMSGKIKQGEYPVHYFSID